MFDAIRRRLGLHVHEWEVVDTRVYNEERAASQPRPGRGGGFDPVDPGVYTVPIEIVTYRCKTCGRETQSRSGVT